MLKEQVSFFKSENMTIEIYDDNDKVFAEFFRKTIDKEIGIGIVTSNVNGTSSYKGHEEAQ